LAHVAGSTNAVDAEWIGFAENVVTPAASAWVFPTLGAMPNNKGQVAEGKKCLLLALAYLNDTLATKTFLNGERASAADCAVVASLSLAFKQVLSPEYRKNIPHVTRWFQTCVHKMPAFGAHTLCAKEAQFDSKTFAAINQKGGKKDQKAKKEQPKKQEKAKPKAEPKPAEPKPVKPKDPFAAMPGDYDMDAWKRCYSNEKTIPNAMNYFWEKLDKENYSVWHCKYQYGHEITMSFMAGNLIRGFYQRIEKMRKHSFASMVYFGGEEKGDIEISGVWFWKGQGLAFELDENWQVDFGQYDWKKLDCNDEANKKLVQSYFAWEGEGVDFGHKKPLINGAIWK